MAIQSISFGKSGLDLFASSARADYRFSPFNGLMLIALMMIGMGIHLGVHTFHLAVVIYAVTAGVVLVSTFRLAQVWEGVVITSTVVALAGYLVFNNLGVPPTILVTTTIAAAIVSPSLQISYQWERAVLLRFGRFVGIRGPGVFFLLPIIDKVAQYVDQRIRVTDFRAETTLTRDTVPVNVDAIAFWVVWDAERSVLEVADFEQAVVLSAQTALRDAIGRSELAELLSHRQRLGEEIQQVLDAKTNPWGITAQSVEIRDIIIPKGLEDAMSKQAQAERERQSRIILGTAETEIAEKFATASLSYRDNPVALHLRAMNMVFEGLKQKGSMVIVPSSAVETMGLGALGGLTALGRPVPTGPAAVSVPGAAAPDEEEVHG